MIVRRLRIHGRVQGVGFRYALCNAATDLELSGWVRNRHDGSVEALVRGPEAAVAQLIAWARRGPPAAQVTRVEIDEAPDEPLPAGIFEQRPSV